MTVRVSRGMYVWQENGFYGPMRKQDAIAYAEFILEAAHGGLLWPDKMAPGDLGLLTPGVLCAADLGIANGES